MCVRENTSQAASVEFVRLWHTNYARSRLQSFCRKNPEDFAAGSLLLPYPGGTDLSISEGKMGTKKAALTAASLAEQKEGKRKGRKQI